METPIYFYLPRFRWPDYVPSGTPSNEYIESIAPSFFQETSLAWTLQTYLRLRSAGLMCELVDYIPEQGIVIGCRGDLPFDVLPRKGVLLCSMNADAGPQPYGQVQIVQNPVLVRRLENSFFLPHWPQPGLINRSLVRGGRFENVAFFGHKDQLASELKTREWEDFLQSLGLKWHVIDSQSERKSDYSDIDLIVAIRSFDGRLYNHKPATKLHNAWIAGIPAILGVESAYRAERITQYDYLEATSYDELRRLVRLLSARVDLRQRMMEAAAIRSREVAVENNIVRWHSLITNELVPLYIRWLEKGIVARYHFLVQRYVMVRREGISERLNSYRSTERS